MNPVPSYLDVPTFGTSATNVKPDDTTYEFGFLAGQLLPAEYHNWTLNRLTENSNTSEDNLLSVQTELVNLLAGAGLTPDSGINDQVLSAVEDIATTIAQGISDPVEAELNDLIDDLESGALVVAKAQQLMGKTSAITFTTTGTTTVPVNVTRMYVSGTAAGGAGGQGGNGGNGAGGGGGAAGEWVTRYPVTVVPGETITVTIGAAGGANTTVVGSTSGSLINLAYGHDGNNGSGSTAGSGGSGVKSGGNGGNGGPGANGSNGSSLAFSGGGGTGVSGTGGGGGGGQSYPGSRGGNGGNGGVGGNNADGYGAGGGGAGGNSLSNGAAGPGVITLEW